MNERIFAQLRQLLHLPPPAPSDPFELPLRTQPILSIVRHPSFFPSACESHSPTLGHRLVEDFGILGPAPQPILASLKEQDTAQPKLLFSLRRNWTEAQVKQILVRSYPAGLRLQERRLSSRVSKKQALPSLNSCIFNLQGAEGGTATRMLQSLNPGAVLYFVCGQFQEHIVPKYRGDPLDPRDVCFPGVYYFASYFPFFQLLFKALEEAVAQLKQGDSHENAFARTVKQLRVRFDFLLGLSNFCDTNPDFGATAALGTKIFRLPAKDQPNDASLTLLPLVFQAVPYEDFHLLFWAAVCQIPIFLASRSTLLSALTILLITRLMLPLPYSCFLFLNLGLLRKQILFPPFSSLISLACTASSFIQAFGVPPNTLLYDLDNHSFHNEKMLSEAKNCLPLVGDTSLRQHYSLFNSAPSRSVRLPQALVSIPSKHKNKSKKEAVGEIERGFRSLLKEVVEGQVPRRQEGEAQEDWVRRAKQEVVERAGPHQQVARRISETQTFTQFLASR